MSSPSSPSPAPAPSESPGLSPADCAAKLKELFPALFSGAPKPLKLRIQADIQERAPGIFTKQALSAFLRRYTGSTSYLIAVSRAKQRFDLDGQPSGELSEEHRKVATDELARRRGLQEARRAQEDQARRERAALLRDFERTTLTPANFCALKGIAPDQLDALLAQARQDAEQRAQQATARPGADRPRGAPGGRGRPQGDRGRGDGPRDAGREGSDRQHRAPRRPKPA